MPNRRPQLELVTPAASEAEAAAVVAAIERFLRDHAPPPAAPATLPGWVQAARAEAVERDPARESWLQAPA